MSAAVVFIAAVLIVAGLVAVAGLRALSRHLPRNRVRSMRWRLHLRRRPGRGHATAFELWLRWGRFAAWRHSGRSRRSLTAWDRFRHPREHSDVFGRTSGVRSKRGPVHVFNPQGIGSVPSTFRWNPVEGCEDPAVAIRRADGFANALKVEGDNAFFQNAARGYLRALFHAAALLQNGDMRLVSHWALTGTKGGAVDAENILRRAGAGRWADELSQLRGAAERTNATNEMVMTQALGFMSDPSLAVSVLPAPDAGLDIGEFLRQSGSLYLIADSDNDESPLAPLFASLASEIHYVAALQGQASPGSRLDPPLLMALDEIVQTCPVPLPKWAADSGGKGIQIITVAHGEAQLTSRWGKTGAQVILDTAGVLMLLPGIKDKDTLRMASELCGTAAYRVRGQEHDSDHDVMTPAMIRQLPKARTLIIRGGLSPVISKLPPVWRERAYRKARRRNEAVAVLMPASVAAFALGEPERQQFAPEPVVRLRPAGSLPGDITPAGWDGEPAEDGAELAEVLPFHGAADDAAPRPWRSS